MTAERSQAHCVGCWSLLCFPSQHCPTTSGGAPSIWACSATPAALSSAPVPKALTALFHHCLLPNHSCPAQPGVTSTPLVRAEPHGDAWKTCHPKEPWICTPSKTGDSYLHPSGQLNHLQHKMIPTVIFSHPFFFKNTIENWLYWPSSTLHQPNSYTQ